MSMRYDRLRRRARLVVAATAAAVVAAAGLTAPARASVTVGGGNVGVQQVLFRGGAAGYGCFRIPALVRTAAGSLLAFAEGRKSPSCGDRGDIDLVVRRSTNGGRTWGPIRVVLSGSDTDPDAPYTRGNPAPVVDQTTGRVLLLTTSNPVTVSGKRLPWIQHSDDDGITWSAAEQLNASFSGADTGWFATGPSHGIQLTKGAYAGRLVVGAHQIPPDSTVATHTVYAGVLYSDDHGATWQASRAANSYVDGVTNPGEVSVAELPDGSVYAAARNQITDTANHRTRAVSTDGGTTMPAFTAVPSLVTPSVEGAVLTLRSTYQSQPGDTLIFSGPSHPEQRRQLKIRYSTDRGTTWKSPANGLIATDRSGYSDVAELAGGEIGVLYEGGPETDDTGNAGFSADEIRFARFTPADIGLPGTRTGTVSTQASPAAGATTPDATAEANDAFLYGATVNTTGRFGQSLKAGGAYAEVPYSRTIDPGSGDFTYSFWFRYDATTASPDQVLFWAYGYGAGVSQVWLRARPKQDQLYAWVNGAGGTADVALQDPSTTTAFGDGAWHHLALVRSGGTVTMTVDGTASAEKAGVAGSVSSGAGLRLGSKGGPTGEFFTGSLDEFRMYRQALGADELARLRTTNAGTAAPALWLPFQVVDTASAPSRTQVSISDDVSGHCASGTVLGGEPVLVDGRSGKALSVDADHKGVEVPFLPALDVGAGDFTFTTWFRHSAGSASPNRALLWAYGLGGAQRQVWVRAQPGDDRLGAWVQDDTGNHVFVTLPDSSPAAAFGDGKWHLLALSRSGPEIRLSVDGGTPATAGGLFGSVTNAGSDIRGLRLGSRLDDADVLTGGLDEFRLYHRALSAAELTAIAGPEIRYPSDNPAVRWTFESGFTKAHSVVRPSPVSGPATPDSSVHCRHAYVRGGATWTRSGRFGAALDLDGTTGAVQLSYGSAEALGAGDFTITTWLRYSASAADRDSVLLWAYGVGATNRQLWLRARPTQDQLYLAFVTETGATTLAAADTSTAAAFGDGQWHHVALRRSAGTLSLAVDGATLASAAVTGSLTYGDTFAVSGFQLGAKPDGTDALHGSLDEFRVFRRALTDAELDSVRLANADLGTVTAVRLPFEVVTTTGFARM
ncbi:sialidase family protein [Dactylosporangium sp. AC04546]|uniref:sialidase family protein n=1 Tax=Dactylosporangium sp. AC04546 TaxID=2862460 RepID=UPI001EE14A2F|nr:sialidase family protein [Dactylosporangium sp. AC04546]WVK79541.1 sialidase family protein [Dactylosporangium sp. AC04546]